MRNSKYYILQVICVGFMSLLIFCSLLFWLDYSFWQEQRQILRANYRQLSLGISPTGLAGNEKSDPNILKNSYIRTELREETANLLGMDEFESNLRKKETYFGVDSGNLQAEVTHNSWYDKSAGVVVMNIYKKQKEADSTRWQFDKRIYAGPEGISEDVKEVGKFVSDGSVYTTGTSLIIFDKQKRKIHKCDFVKMVVQSGEELGENLFPVKIGTSLGKNFDDINLQISAPYFRVSEEEAQNANRSDIEYVNFNDERVATKRLFGWTIRNYNVVTVLDNKEKVRFLDLETLELSNPVASLGQLRRLLGNTDIFNKSFAYRLSPVFSYKKPYKKSQFEHIGTVLSAVSSNLERMDAVIVDANGKTIAAEVEWLSPKNYARGPMLNSFRFVVESFAPYALHIVSPWARIWLEPDKWYRQIYTMPDSVFISKAALESRSRIVFIIMNGVLALPSFVIGVLLATRLGREAGRLGMSSRSRFWWSFLTVLFGVPAFITFKLTVPKEALVTCENCGSLRRCDQYQCHVCKRGWSNEDLAAPNWRVFDSEALVGEVN